MRRAGLLLALLALVAGCAADDPEPAGSGTPGPGGDASATGATPIVVISIDTLRADRLPAYGYDGVETPAIDALRADGILFARAWTSVPLTLPAHASLFTGLQPPAHGIRDNLGYRLDPATPTLAAALGAAGYATGGAVSAYVLRAATGIGSGFDTFDDRIEVTAQTIGELQRPGAETVARALDWLDRQTGPRIFLFVHLFEPHSPYTPPEPFAGRYESAYDGEVAAADAAVGELLEGLRRRGLYDPALVVLLSDHGEGLGDHGEEEHGVLLHRETLQVPLIVKLPSSERAGDTVARTVQLRDLPATVAGLVGLDAEFPGSDLLAPDADAAAPAYAETYHARLHFGWSELRSLVDGDIHFIDGPRPELYDLAADPGETRNAIQDRRADARRLRAELEAIEPAFLPPAESDPAEMEKLRALGYLAAPVRATGSLPDPKENLPLLRRVRAALRTAASGRHAEAVAGLEAVLAENPDMLDVRFQLAQSLTAMGRLDEALAHYRRALESGSIAVPALLVETGRILLAKGELDEAASHAEGALGDLPVEARQLLAQVAVRRGDLDTALTEAEAAVAAEGLPRAESLLLLGRIRLARGEHGEALATLDRVRARVDAGRLAPVRGLEAERGEALGRLDRLAEAEEALRREIATFPDHAIAYQRLCFVLGAQQRFTEIEPTLEAMVRANSAPATYLLAADTARRLGDVQGADAWERRARAAQERLRAATPSSSG